MQKYKFVDFITKYNIAKNEQVIFNVENKTMKVESKPEPALRLSVELANIDLADGSFGVLDTKTFKAMLNVMFDEIKIEYGMNGESIRSLNVEDQFNRKIKLVTADLSIFTETPPVKSLPNDYPIIMNTTSEFFRDFQNSLNALNVENVMFTKFDKLEDMKLVFGFNSTSNTDMITFPLGETLATTNLKDVCIGELKENVFFNAKNILEILFVNRDLADSGTIKINDKIMVIEYDMNDFKCQYLLIAMDI